MPDETPRWLEDRVVDDHGVHISSTLPVRGGRRAMVNLMESPLSWLLARKMVTQRQYHAGEKLRGDYERAALGARVTMHWDDSPRKGRKGGTAVPADPSLQQVDAKRRFDAAIACAGPGLQDILWRVICAGEGLTHAEKNLGWPNRAGKLVLCLALDRVAQFYRI